MEEGGLLFQLGIDWKLLLSQAVNFFILLIVLKQFVYKPLMKVMKERRDKIKEGLDKAEEADVRLKEVDNIAKEKIKTAEGEAVGIIKATEQKAKELEQSLQKRAEEKQKELLAQIQASAEKQREEAKQAVLKDAEGLVRQVIVKTVELKPEAIDQALIEKAAKEIGK